MSDTQLWLKGVDLASIATSLMVIAAAVVIYVSWATRKRSSKK